MKAEQLKNKIRQAIATSIHSNPNSLGFQGYDDATEKCLKLIEQYTRVQIEKDRERIKYLLTEHLSTHVSGNIACCLNSVNETPIILD